MILYFLGMAIGTLGIAIKNPALVFLALLMAMPLLVNLITQDNVTE